MRRLFGNGIIAAAIIVAGCCNAYAAEINKGAKLFLTSTTSFRGAPTLGASQGFDLNFRYYYSDSDSMLFKNNFVGGGIGDAVSPATNASYGFIEVEPIAVFNLKVQYEYLQYFGAFSAMFLFPDGNADYSDERLKDMQDNDKAVWGTGTHLSVKPTFQAMYKRIVLMDTLSFDWYDLNKDHDLFFYMPDEDLLSQTKDYIFSNSAIGGVIVWKKSDEKMMILGSRHVYYRIESTGRERQELDGVLVWMMGEKVWIMEKPMLMAAVGGYLDDRYREQDIFAGGMFSFQYSLTSR